jgi:hypothetical protein
MDAKADRIQTYPFPCTPCVEIREAWIKAHIFQRYMRSQLSALDMDHCGVLYTYMAQNDLTLFKTRIVAWE